MVNTNNLSLDGGTSTIEFTSASPNYLYSSGSYVPGQFIYNVTFNGPGVINGDWQVDGTMSLKSGLDYTFESNRTIYLNGNIAVSGTCGYNAILKTNSVGSAVNFIRTSGTLTANGITLKDNFAAGGATFIANNSINAGNVTGWTINQPVPGNFYWIGGGGYWSDPSHWSLTSGGTPGSCIPGANDDVYFDANSGFTPGSYVYFDLPDVYCHSMDWTGAQNNPVMVASGNSNLLHINGSLTLINAMTLAYYSYIYFDGTNTGNTITMAGQSFYYPVWFNGNGGSWIVQDSLVSNNDIYFDYGTINTNGKPLTCGNFYSNPGNTRTLILGNSNIKVNTYFLINSNGLQMDGGTSTINFLSTSTNYLYMTGSYSSGQFVYNVNFAGPAYIYGDWQIDGTLALRGGQIYIFESNRTIYLNGNIGKSGNVALFSDIRTTSNGTQVNFIKTSGCVFVDYVSMRDVNAQGGATFNLGVNSLNMGNNSGWNFNVTYGCAVTWTGNSSNDWNNGGNWSNGMVPATTSDITIPAGMPKQPVITSAAECHDITILSGAVVTINPGFSLTASGITTMSGAQCIVIKSNISGSGSFIDNGTINGSGTAKVERFLTANDWHYVSKPLVTATAGVFTGQYIKRWNENSYSWTNLTSPSTALVTMQGYAVKSGTSKAYSFIGTLNTGAKTKSLTRTSSLIASKRGWNLVGNPYPSAIDWDASSGWTKTSINNAIYIYNQNYSNYATYIAGLGTNGGSRYIAPEQGFFVICNPSATGMLGMDNNVRVHSSAPFMKSAATQDYIRLAVNKNDFSDEIIVRFNTDASSSFDADLDAYKIIDNSITQLWSMAYPDLTEQYSINSLENVQSSPDVPVAFNPTTSGTFTLNASEFENLAAQTGIYLEDLKTGVVTDLIENPNYQFTATAGDDINRFALHFAPWMTTTPENAGTNSGIQIYPNPNTGSFTIIPAKEIEGNVTIELYDVQGRIVYSTVCAGFTTKNIDVDNLQPGVYSLKMNGGNSVTFNRIVIGK